MAAVRHEDGHIDEGTQLRRRGLLLGGLAAAAAGVFGRERAAEAASGDPVIAGERNAAQSATELVTGGHGPGLAVRQTSVPGDEAMPFAGAGVAGLGERFGMLGSTLLPRELSISELAPDVRAGVSGFGDRFGVLGSTLLPRELSISELAPDVRAGVSGFGDRFGMLGSTLAPGELSLTAPVGVGVSGISDDLGVWGMRGTGAATPRLGPAGVLGSATGEGTGVAAENEAGFAFRSLGRLAFSTAGEGLIAAGQATGTVENAAIRKDSLANVTLLSAPGVPSRLVHAEPQDGALTVHLSHPAREPTRFAYFVFHGLE